MKTLILLFILFPLFVNAQQIADWQHLDPGQDSVLGVSSYKAYKYLKGRESKTVTVAILDNGAELSHPDLQGQFWINEDEVPGNGIDDDKNGYVDDIHGWNFLGNAKGENIKRETTELTRFYRKLGQKYDSINKSNAEYLYAKKIQVAYLKAYESKMNEIQAYKEILYNYRMAERILGAHFKNEAYDDARIKSIPDSFKLASQAKAFILSMHANQLNQGKIEGIISNMEQDVETRLNPNFNIRSKIIGDNPDDLSDSIYGNNMVDAMGPYHGTGVAGTIGALWGSDSVSGIAKNVKLMILRVLPNGDERDKDIALAIRYAVRNGAAIISCSFGKMYSMHPEFVQQAIKEAEEAGVLIVHAAGNDSKNNDSTATYPTGFYQDGTRAGNWLCVGASGMKDNENLLAFFSNYGKKTVDVFAPGVDIKSCVLGGEYDWASGTSTAAPVVAGIAAVLKSYFPDLKAAQLKEILIQSAYQPKTKQVYLRELRKRVDFKKLSVSGGIADLYRAVLLAEMLAGDK